MENSYQFKEGELTFLLHDFKKMDIAPEGFFPTFKEGYRLAKSRQESNEQAFIEWLTQEINYLESIPLTEYGDGKRAAFQKIKDYFISLTNPTNNTSNEQG